jgi:hypothetical protein
MIIYFDGDSFTHGAELYEELHVPGYTKIKSVKEAMTRSTMVEPFDKQDIERRDLTYTGTFKKLYPKALILNHGHSGSSQMSIAYRTINNLTRLRQEQPNEEIVCVIQDTTPDRVWLWNERGANYMDFIVACPQFHPNGPTEGYKLQKHFLEYYPQERMHLEYFMVSNSIKYHCIKNNIKYYHWRIADSFYRQILTPNLSLETVTADFFDPKDSFENQFGDLIFKKFGNNATLPGLHYKIEVQPFIAQVLNSKLVERGIL